MATTQYVRRGGRRFGRERVVGYIFLLPTLILVGLFSYYPAVRAATSAFTQWDGFNPPKFIGVKNFVTAFQQSAFTQSLAHVGIWTVIGVPLALVPSFIVAELIFRLPSERHQYVWRSVIVAPLVLPQVVFILIWQNLYSPDGVINQLVRLLGLSKTGPLWLADPRTALWSLIFLGFPWVLPFYVLLFYAGLRAIPPEVLEAAALDGASRLKQVFLIEVPLTFGQWKLLLILAIIGVTQNLLVPLVLTDGGPVGATTTPVVYMYQQAINYGQYGYGMSIGTMLFAAVFAVSLINMRFLRGDR